MRCAHTYLLTEPHTDDINCWRRWEGAFQNRAWGGACPRIANFSTRHHPGVRYHASGRLTLVFLLHKSLRLPGR